MFRFLRKKIKFMVKEIPRLEIVFSLKHLLRNVNCIIFLGNIVCDSDKKQNNFS